MADPHGMTRWHMADGVSDFGIGKKRSLWLINEHFEEDFNAVLPSVIVFEQPDMVGVSRLLKFLAER